MSKRPDIIAAAQELLWEHGYEATSPRMVLDRSGAGQGSLYHHFEGKKELAVVALEGVESELTEALASTLEDHAREPLDRVLAWLAAPRDALRGCRLGRLANEYTVVEDDQLRQPLALYFGKLERRLGETIIEAIDAGTLPTAIDAANLAALLIATVQGGYVLSRITRDPHKLEEATGAARALLINATKPTNGR